MFGLFGGKKRRGGDGRNTLPDGVEVHLALYKYDTCPYCRFVYRALDELSVNIEYRDIRQERSHLESLMGATGRRTVPCLFIDGEAMFESADIVAWLRANFPSGSSS